MKNIFTFLLLLSSLSTFGQLDTMIVYDLATKTYEIIPPIEYDETITNDKTVSSIGTIDGITLLSNEIPTENLFPDTDFTRLVKTADLFDLSSYPMRTSVKLDGMTTTGTSSECSGTLISENMVLTAAHCAFDFFGNIEFFVESIDALPSYDKGESPTGIPSAKVTKVFLTKKTFDGDGFFDACLLLLDEPIGATLGYQGFGFAPVDELTQKVFHKMSYPAVNSNTIPVEFYNGDTTYYNYGLISYDWILGFLELDSPNAQGIPGQSGSGLFESINDAPTIYGVMNYSNYQHSRILPSYFYQMKNIVDIYGLISSNETIEKSIGINIYPNPFDHMTKISLSDIDQENTPYKLVDLSGRILQEGNFDGNQLILLRNNLTNGIYILSVHLENGTTVSKRLIVK